MSRARWLVLLLAGCGSLVEYGAPSSADGGTMTSADGGTTQGLFCANDDPCVCDPCTSTAQCASGLSCLPGRRRGMDCSDGRSVCTTGP